jgi:hypothetical protein
MIRALQQVLCMHVPTRQELVHPALWWTRGELLIMRGCYLMWRQQHIVHDPVDLLAPERLSRLLLRPISDDVVVAVSEQPLQ